MGTRYDGNEMMDYDYDFGGNQLRREAWLGVGGKWKWEWERKWRGFTADMRTRCMLIDYFADG